MGLKIYLAAPWIDKDKMDERAAPFENVGAVITHKWWKIESEGINNSDKVMLNQALKDYYGVKNADLVVLFNTSKSEGKSVEQGIAIANEKPIVAIGNRRTDGTLNVFHWLGNYTWVENIDQAVDNIKARSNG